MLGKEHKNIGYIKQTLNIAHECPLCKEKILLGVELDTLQQLNQAQYFPYPHIHLHGNPLHAMLCYIDKDLKVRNTGVIKSIEISRDSETFNQLVKKWSNPY